MKPTWIIGIIIVAVVLVLATVAVALGWIEIPGLNLGLQPGDEEAPPGAVYCDYTELQILDMLETVVGKELDNAVGVTFVRGLNMQACGSDGASSAEIAMHYQALYSEWYSSLDDTTSGAGWTARRLVWGNAPTNATLAVSVLIGSGVTVTQAYGYDTITITSDGPVLTYQAFLLWIATS